MAALTEQSLQLAITANQESFDVIKLPCNADLLFDAEEKIMKVRPVIYMSIKK